MGELTGKQSEQAVAEDEASQGAGSEFSVTGEEDCSRGRLASVPTPTGGSVRMQGLRTPHFHDI